MNVHWLQHVPFEGLGVIETWVRDRGHRLDCTRFWAGQRLPELACVDLLVVMGGPMGVCDEKRYPWLVEEKRFIREAADTGRTILGICLGAQLLAQVFGAEVHASTTREIGWFPVTCSDALPDWAAEFSEREMMVFHWHGDSFELPAGAVHLYASRCCANQGFAIDDRIVGLQFHAEMTETGIQALIDHCSDELEDVPENKQWIQPARQIIDNLHFIEPAQRYMGALLNQLECQTQSLRS